MIPYLSELFYSIEGYPVIIRFKTSILGLPNTVGFSSGIEGYPVIIRFKTEEGMKNVKKPGKKYWRLSSYNKV